MRLVRRLHEINRLRWKLERNSFPRLQMSLIVALTGASGFLASYCMLQAELTEMWLRYLCALGIAYLVFLFLLWLWLKTSAQDYVDVPDPSLFASSKESSDNINCEFDGSGGDFGGGGASGSFDASTPSDFDSGNVLGDAIGAAAETEEFAIPLIVLILLGAVLFSIFFVIFSVIYSAPIFFAELLLDGVLSATLYRRLRGVETRHWLETAFRRTIIPFIVTALIFAVAGWGMNFYAPDAQSIGDVIAHAKYNR